MRSPRIRNPLCGIVASVFLFVGVAAAAPCPESCTSNSFVPSLCSTLPSRDHTQSASCAPYPGTVSIHEFYDLVAGTIQANALSCEMATVNGFAVVYAKDRFRIVGPAGSDVISFQARLVTNGSAGGFGTVSAGIREIGGESRNVNDNGLGGFATTLVLPLAHPVGQEFDLEYEVSAAAQISAQAQGQLAFTGFPPGYGVMSCQGYAGEGAVPARRTTWGAIKSIYR